MNMENRKHQQELSRHCLKLCHNYAQQFKSMLKLIDCMAFERLKEDSPMPLTVMEVEEWRQKIGDYVGFTFVSNYEDYSPSRRRLVDRNKYNQLKSHVDSIIALLEEADIGP